MEFGDDWLFLRRFDSILNLKTFQRGYACKQKIKKKGVEELRGVKYRRLDPIKRFGQGDSSILVADLDRQPIDLKDQSGRFDKTC